MSGVILLLQQVQCSCAKLILWIHVPHPAHSHFTTYVPPSYAVEGNVFIVSVCLSVRAITFETIDLETSFLVWWYILDNI